jgi:hypothetical protein
VVGVEAGSSPLPSLLTGFVADLARSRAIEADEHRRTADLTADLAHLLLRAENLRSALPTAAYRLAQALKLPYAAIEPGAVAAGSIPVTRSPRQRPRSTGTPGPGPDAFQRASSAASGSHIVRHSG